MILFSNPYALALSAIILAVILMQSGQYFAQHWGWIDNPGGRKTHAKPTPLHGGAAMFVALLPALIVFALAHPPFWTFVIGSTLLVVLGVIDDFQPISARWRFLAQGLAAGLICIQGGVMLQDFGDLLGFGAIHLGFLTAALVTPITMIGLINAINMLDGVDGLSATVVLQFFAWCAGLMLWGDMPELWGVILPCMAITLAYLAYNFPWRRGNSATLFMGDAGSMLLGLITVWLAITLSQYPHQVAPPVLFLWLLAMPLYDTGQVMWQRLCCKQSLFAPDRNHLHHLLQDRGFSARKTVCTMNGLVFVLAAVGIGLWSAGVAECWMLLLFVVGFVAFLRVLKRMALRFKDDDLFTP